METTFKEFVYDLKDFDKETHYLYTSLLASNEIEIVDFLFYYLDFKYNDVKKLKKLIKNYKIKYKYNIETKNIILDRKDFNYIFFNHGSIKLKNYLSSLPYFLSSYENYINDKRFKINIC